MACLSVPGTCVSIPWPEDGLPGAARVCLSGVCVQVTADQRDQPILRDLGRERGWQDGDHQVYPPVPVLSHQQCQHLGRTADTGGQHHPRGFW